MDGAQDFYTGSVNQAAADLVDNLSRVSPAETAALVERVAAAASGSRAVVAYGVGREGLCMCGFAMRLYHLGVRAAVAGDMTAPRVGQGDVLVVSAGPGSFSTAAALAGEARAAGAAVVALTAQPGGVAFPADLTVRVPAKTMARGGEGGGGGLPLGSAYELALHLYLDVVALAVGRRLGVDERAMAARHTNLE